MRKLLASLLGLALTTLPLYTVPQNPEIPEFRFVSMPDWLNADIGDVGDLTTPAMTAAGVTGQSTSPDFEANMDSYLQMIADQNPAFVLVAGDLTSGWWYRDYWGVERFGPVGTLEEKKAAIKMAGDLYYGQWLERFDEKGLTVHPALGDHDIGDNPWPAGWDKTKAFQTYKSVFADWFTHPGGVAKYPDRPKGTWFENTAYGFRQGNLYVLTVDVFAQEEYGGEVDAYFKQPQLDWIAESLSRVQADPTIDFVIVQGHTPVLGPVAQEGSSGLMLRDGQNSEFWQLLAQYPKVKLYLAGEVHTYTKLEADGIVQLSHGSTLGRTSQMNYLVADVFTDRMELTIMSAPQVKDTSSPKLWATELNKNPHSEFTIGSWSVLDTLTITP